MQDKSFMQLKQLKVQKGRLLGMHTVKKEREILIGSGAYMRNGFLIIT
jgi:hypothetical protein